MESNSTPIVVSLNSNNLISLTGFNDDLIADCTECSLHKSAKNAVSPLFISSSLSSIDLMLIGEGPGATEDKEGRPFVGLAGALLQNILYDAELTEKIYITNVVKHRPPKNRKPTQEEMTTCGTRYLEKEIRAANPKAIVCLGRTAAEFLATSSLLIKDPEEGWKGSLRGRSFLMGIPDQLIRTFITWHPAYILRQTDKRSELVEDLQLVKEYIKYIESIT